MSGTERCCDQDYGGSHYHCAHCGRVSSMMGHYCGAVYPDGFGSRTVKIPGAMICSREWERQVRDVLGDKADAVIARHRKGIPLAEPDEAIDTTFVLLPENEDTP